MKLVSVDDDEFALLRDYITCPTFWLALTHDQVSFAVGKRGPYLHLVFTGHGLIDGARKERGEAKLCAKNLKEDPSDLVLNLACT